jgi:hypothetical protein
LNPAFVAAEFPQKFSPGTKMWFAIIRRKG